MSELLDQHMVAAIVDTRHPGVPEHARTYLQSRDGHWLVKFARPKPRAGDSPKGDLEAAAGIGYVNCCLVNGTSGEIAHLPHPDQPLPVGFGPDSVDWPAVFGR